MSPSGGVNRARRGSFPRVRNKTDPLLFAEARFNRCRSGHPRRPMVGTIEHVRLCRLRAAEMRALASTIEDESARRGVLNAARSYDAIAADAEARLNFERLIRDLPTTEPA